MKQLFVLISCIGCLAAYSQQVVLKGIITDGQRPVAWASLRIQPSGRQQLADSLGSFSFTLPVGKQILHVTAEGFHHARISLNLHTDTVVQVNLSSNTADLEEVVVTGTMKEVSKTASPVPVEVYTPKYFQKGAPAHLFDAVCMINGVKPQLNCNICNTGDIHINGMEGPYTQVLIDGMPVVSGLATVYGLMGIPISMIERVEVIKGPAASLYGSEAMGGTINVITRNPAKAPLLSIDMNASSYGEYNVDAGLKLSSRKVDALLGVNYFHYGNRVDKNNDGFTDVTLQQRFSLFNKWMFKRSSRKLLQAGLRLYYEDRWGGQMQWNKQWRGSDSIYGESIYTRRLETFGTYELPLAEKVYFNWSFNIHDQNSFYGTTPYNAIQDIAFTQLHWDKTISRQHNLLTGLALRYTYYNDNTTATLQPQNTYLPGFFVQDEWKMDSTNTLLSGVRIDHNNVHGWVVSPRLAYKKSIGTQHIVRASAGTGFRVVNIFSEDHAALTGAREVVIAEALKPEQSINGVINWQMNIASNGNRTSIEASLFYSHYFNKIIPDYDTDPNKIIYANLAGYGTGRGISVNIDHAHYNGIKLNAGVSYMDVFQTVHNGQNEKVNIRQVQAPRWSGNMALTKTWVRQQLSIDITGNVYGPMRLPILPNDYRPEYSPWFGLFNMQCTKKWDNGIELYGGIKNLFDFFPDDPIMRPFDPFDKHAADPVANPNGYTFDPSYNYAPLQSRRGYIGFRYTIR